jgi:hypothetical protein
MKRLLRLSVTNPKDDYIFVRDGSEHGLACRRTDHRQVAVLRVSHSLCPLTMMHLISQVQHPNIAATVDAYFHDGQLWIASEYLDVSLLELQQDIVPLGEWEVATILSEVCMHTQRSRYLLMRSNDLPVNNSTTLRLTCVCQKREM